ncbi:hypothetical protein KIH39_18410 [Telmatocola sphagniphila]|uniref:Uncharacterized protein n=1 Tax=Telmatocola sphagniphila TaxID=1123043 RepID=A0A8E6B318_9BACT|nr:hypothetical protein [Telmatocola sphagniphila]QVL30811.1 hypothetical protein KIH39_18410 [Telmatocola sphagniphila]
MSRQNRERIAALGEKEEKPFDWKAIFERFVREVDAEFRRLGSHGASELAASLYTGSAFVLYGKEREQLNEVSRINEQFREIERQQEELQRGL